MSKELSLKPWIGSNAQAYFQADIMKRKVGNVKKFVSVKEKVCNL